MKGVRGGSECRETTSEGKWPRNVERDVDPEFTGEEDGGKIFQSSRGERYSGGNISEGGKKKNRKKGVISALKIVSFPIFLSPGNSSCRV